MAGGLATAEGQAQVRVLQAKGESDAMQYTLPLKQKQIEQSRLEAEARKESTIKNAEAAAEAKVIDSKAEMERRKLLADAEADRIRAELTAEGIVVGCEPCDDQPYKPIIDNLRAIEEAHAGAAAKTIRERLEQHRRDPACAGCSRRTRSTGSPRPRW